MRAKKNDTGAPARCADNITDADAVTSVLAATEEQLRHWVHMVGDQMEPAQLRHLLLHIIEKSSTEKPN